MQLKGVIATLVGSLALGIFSAFLDWVWAAYIPQHKVIYGVLHGVVLCLTIGLALAFISGGEKPWLLGLLGEPLIGAVAAGVFYLLYKPMGWASMFLAWMVLWILTAFLYDRMCPKPRGPRGTTIRGVVAAILSGLAFWAISDIWLDPPEVPNYLWFATAWTFAFLPGMSALIIELKRS